MSLYATDQRLSEMQIYQESLRLTRYALLVSDGPLVIPPKYAVEVPYFRKYIHRIRPIISAGLLQRASTDPDFGLELEDKRIQYQVQPLLFPGYFDRKLSRDLLADLKMLPWTPRVGPSATQSITRKWLESLEEPGGVLMSIARTMEGGTAEVEKNLATVPERLSGSAFILRHVELALRRGLSPEQRLQINYLINSAYLRNYLSSVDGCILVETFLGDLDCGLLSAENAELSSRLVSFRSLHRWFGILGLRETIETRLSWSDLVMLREDLLFRWLVSWLLLADAQRDGRSLEDTFRIAGCYTIGNEARSRQIADIPALREFLRRIHERLQPYYPASAADEVFGLKRAARGWVRSRMTAVSVNDKPPQQLVFPYALSSPQEGDMSRDLVFVSYSHKDHAWLERLMTMLRPMTRAGLVATWDDTKIRAGDDWRDEIDRALSRAKIAVMLVSANFLASDFIANNELPPLLESAIKEGLRVIWVPVSSSLYRLTELARFQAAHDPSRPLESLSKPDQDAALVKICEAILDACPSGQEPS